MDETTCHTCRHGCSCDPAAGQSCEHYGCQGRADRSPSCPGALPLIVEYTRRMDEEHRRTRLLRMRRALNSTAYARLVAQAGDRGRLEVAVRVAEARPPVES